MISWYIWGKMHPTVETEGAIGRLLDVVDHSVGIRIVSNRIHRGCGSPKGPRIEQTVSANSPECVEKLHHREQCFVGQTRFYSHKWK